MVLQGTVQELNLRLIKIYWAFAGKTFAQEKDCTVHYYDTSDIITIFKGSSPNFASNIERI